MRGCASYYRKSNVNAPAPESPIAGLAQNRFPHPKAALNAPAPSGRNLCSLAMKTKSELRQERHIPPLRGLKFLWDVSATKIPLLAEFGLLAPAAATGAGYFSAVIPCSSKRSMCRSRSDRLPAQVALWMRSTISPAHASSSTCSLMNQCMSTWAG